MDVAVKPTFVVFLLTIVEAFVEPPLMYSINRSSVLKPMDFEVLPQNEAAILDTTLVDPFGKPVESSHRKFFSRSRSQYVDKTLFIRDMLTYTPPDETNVVLITRPRGFGKSLALSSLYYFCDYMFKNAADLFFNLKIMKEDPILKTVRENYMSKWPVIWIDFETVKYRTGEQNFIEIKRIISNIFQGHQYLLQGDKMGPFDRKKFQQYLLAEANETETKQSIIFLCRHIFEYSRKKPIVLIDNYDVPFLTGYMYSYFEEMSGFLWEFYYSFMKDEYHVEKVIVTGVTQIHEDNSLRIIQPFTVLNDKIFSENFGFTDKEVSELLKRSQSKILFQTLMERSGGYPYGNQTVFNPLSVINQIFSKKHYQGAEMESMQLSEKILVSYGLYPVLSIQQLLIGASLRKKLTLDVYLPHLEYAEVLYWSYLVHSGYLTSTEIPGNMQGTGLLRVPNLEVSKKIEYLFREFKVPDYNGFIENVRNGNQTEVKDFIFKYIQDAGKYLRFGKNDSIEILQLYVGRMLQGLEARYSTMVKVTKKSNAVTLEVETKSGDPVIVTIQKMANIFGRSWGRIRSRLCSVLRPLGKSRPEILIIVDEDKVVDICMKYSFKMRSQ